MKQRFQAALKHVLKSQYNLSPTSKLPSLRSHVTYAKSLLPPFSTSTKSTQNPKCFSAVFATSVVLGASIAASAAFIYNRSQSLYAEAPPQKPDAQNIDSKERKIRLSELPSHGPTAPTKWITHGTRVYDITSFLPLHPGGDIILRAAGSSIDPYWDIFSIHKINGAAELLEEYYIGDVDERDLDVDGKVRTDGMGVDDPFKWDPKREEGLVVLTERPFNGETGPDGLGDWITPSGVFYVRNHLWVPELKAEEHNLVVELPDGEEKAYSLSDLKSKFSEVTIAATLQCSGNRRKHMNENARAANGLQWGVGAASNAVWTGVRLRDVLSDAGLNIDDLPEDAKHAQFLGAESYGASIPIETAVDKRGDVLLAYEMNGEPLPPDHGYPVRVLVPGTVAARSVKWVRKVVVSEEESESQWQRRDYKVFGPNVGGISGEQWEEAPAIQDMPVQSAITRLRKQEEEDCVVVEGYAWSGGGRKIVRVDISADDGKNWQQAELLPDESLGSKAWAWKRWRWIVPRSQAGSVFVVKAVDEASNTQPREYEPYWNFRGNLTQSWHRVGCQSTER